jgi:sec-independent protein translocase protein TatC
MAKNSGEMTFLEHLEEFRWVIVRSLLAIVIGATLAFIFKSIIFDNILLGPRTPEFISNRLVCKLGHFFIENKHLSSLGHLFHTEQLCINRNPLPLQNITMGGQFNMHIWVSLVAGTILAFPYVIYQLWSFIAPALHEKERSHSRGAVIYTSSLFILGVLFGYFILLPFSIDFLSTYTVSDQIENKINFVSYITNITTIVMATGLSFELPIVVYFLTKIGILSPTFMRKYRKHAIIVILVIAAIITPPDVFSQIMVSIPLLLLYEISIFISARIVKNKNKA